MPNYPNMSKGQMGTYNEGAPMTGMKSGMGAGLRKKKRKGNPIAAVAAFKKQMRVK